MNEKIELDNEYGIAVSHLMRIITLLGCEVTLQKIIPGRVTAANQNVHRVVIIMVLNNEVTAAKIDVSLADDRWLLHGNTSTITIGEITLQFSYDIHRRQYEVSECNSDGHTKSYMLTLPPKFN